jgi:hypothetical protein
MYRLFHNYSKKIILWICIGMLYLSGNTPIRAQFYTIPDVAFRAHIVSTYPGIVNGSNQLIISQAPTVEGPFSITSGVTNLDGIQYFTAVDTLYSFGNPLTDLSYVTSMTDLKVIQIQDGNITALPTNLNQLTNLKELNFEWNKLTSLPSLNGLVNLKFIKLWQNSITQLPDLSSLSSLELLDMNDNPLATFPTMAATMPNLKRINLNGASIKAIPSFPIMPLIDTIRYNWGELESLPSIAHLTNLKTLLLADNNLSSLPSFSSLPNLIKVDVRNNQLTFEDIVPLTSYPSFSSIYKVFPQDSIGKNGAVSLNEAQPFAIKLDFDKQVTNNIYSWYKDGSLVATTSTNWFKIEEVKPEDAGNYYCVVTNSTPALSGQKIVTKLTSLEVKNASATKPDKKELVLTPNGDGLGDVYYFEETGRAKIYDRYGRIVRDIVFPAYWDGTNSSGELVTSGYYIIKVEDKVTIPVTVIR